MSRKWFSSGAIYNKPDRVDREAGVLHGIAVVSVGEAKGHGVNLDREFIDNVVSFGNEKKSGVKARFGHPNMSSTALGTFLGRFKNFRVDGHCARADLYLSNEAKYTPHGDLYEYVLGMAENESDMLGASIVFTPGKEYQRNGDEKVYSDFSRKDPIFTEIEKLHAADIVDDPAAAPDGMFSAWSAKTWAGQVTEFLDTHPNIYELLEDNPEVMTGFMDRYNQYRKRYASDDSDLESLSEDNEIDVTFEEDTKMEKEKIVEEAKAEETARFNALKDAFPKRPEFVVEQYAKGNDVLSAKAELADVLLKENADLSSQLAAKTAEEKTEEVGGEAVAFTGEQSADKSFDTLVKEQIAAGKSASEAIRFCANNHPEAYDKASNEKGA